MPRLINAPQFKLDDLCGQRIRALIGYSEGDSDQVVEMLFLRISDDGIWHRLFLDAGIGFWETWPKKEAFSEYEKDRRIDFADRWGLLGAEILTAECFGSGLVESGLSSFRIELTMGALNFGYADLNDMESETILDFNVGIYSRTESKRL